VSENKLDQTGSDTEIEWMQGAMSYFKSSWLNQPSYACSVPLLNTPMTDYFMSKNQQLQLFYISHGGKYRPLHSADLKICSCCHLKNKGFKSVFSQRWQRKTIFVTPNNLS